MFSNCFAINLEVNLRIGHCWTTIRESRQSSLFYQIRVQGPIKCKTLTQAINSKTRFILLLSSFFPFFVSLNLDFLQNFWTTTTMVWFHYVMAFPLLIHIVSFIHFYSTRLCSALRRKSHRSQWKRHKHTIYVSFCHLIHLKWFGFAPETTSRGKTITSLVSSIKYSTAHTDQAKMSIDHWPLNRIKPVR